jgi:hypothetical protein
MWGKAFVFSIKQQSVICLEDLRKTAKNVIYDSRTVCRE